MPGAASASARHHPWRSGRHRQERRMTDRIKKARVLSSTRSRCIGANLAVSQVCRHIKDNLPFGGLQVVLVGDFFQLPPVIRRDRARRLRNRKPGRGGRLAPFAYASRAWRDLDPGICYLTEQHRQADAEFSSLLGAIRSNRFGKEAPAAASRRLAQDACREASPGSSPTIWMWTASIRRNSSSFRANPTASI